MDWRLRQAGDHPASRVIVPNELNQVGEEFSDDLAEMTGLELAVATGANIAVFVLAGMLLAGACALVLVRRRSSPGRYLS